MASTLIINDRNYETRVALLENDQVAELYVERQSNTLFVGNIYKGKVMKVLPGMQSAFIDIGLDKAAFLYVDDVKRISDDDVDFDREIKPIISNLLKEGQNIIVQVSKEAIGTKGPRVTTNITLPGRYLVLAPLTQTVGISRKIENKDERDRLKDVLRSLSEMDGFGLIARTASEGVSERLLRRDYDFLVKFWQEISKKQSRISGRGLIHSEMEVSIRVIRDVLNESVKKIVVDNRDTYKVLRRYLGQYEPKLRRLVSFYPGPEPIFEAYGVEHELERALQRRVWLKSGGYIVIDQAEASVIIDVNTGRYVGSRNQDETILNTNLEAAKEIGYQLRLRNLGGIIVIDFIDMDKEDHKEKVLTALKESLKKDRAKTNVLDISDLGLVEMTRKRIRESVSKTVCSPCPYCDGRGYSKSYKTVAYEVFRELERDATYEEIKVITVYLNPAVLDYIYQNEKPLVEYIQKKYNKNIVFEADEKLHHEQYEISLLS